ncbi:MAG: type sorting protein [Sphingobacteriaceae bacterium]|jgi:hypothetical protein|nr:type sorting protein [Sphingobacteriaceae bacterium]
MRKLYFQFVCLPLLVLAALTASVSSGFAYDGPNVDTLKNKQPKASGKITDTRKNKPSTANSIKVDYVPFKPFNTKDAVVATNNAGASKPVKQDDGKILNNVKVYPNPVEDELNLSYHINKDSNVTIKIMDVLGNEIATLFSQKTSAGDRSNTFNLSSRLKSGFYFIRLVAGQETIIKRISVL